MNQQVMKVTIRGQEIDFLVLKPVEPGATLRNAVRLGSRLQHCESVGVKLDTATGLKFQVGRGASANADVFANDSKTLVARDTRPADASRGRGVVRDCERKSSSDRVILVRESKPRVNRTVALSLPLAATRPAQHGRFPHNERD
jgi:hypothetical protein